MEESKEFCKGCNFEKYDKDKYPCNICLLTEGKSKPTVTCNDCFNNRICWQRKVDPACLMPCGSYCHIPRQKQ